MSQYLLHNFQIILLGLILMEKISSFKIFNNIMLTVIYLQHYKWLCLDNKSFTIIPNYFKMIHYLLNIF